MLEQGGFITGIKKPMYTQKYRVRATIKLSPSGENLDSNQKHNMDAVTWKSDLMIGFYKL